jgi:formamidopyrimidine-DNA glycosylase
MNAGQPVWIMDSSKIRVNGVYKMVHTSIQLTVAKARKNYRCRNCGEIIIKGELHGSSYCYHWCRDCVLTEEPETRIEPIS